MEKLSAQETRGEQALSRVTPQSPWKPRPMPEDPGGLPPPPPLDKALPLRGFRRESLQVSFADHLRQSRPRWFS